MTDRSGSTARSDRAPAGIVREAQAQLRDQGLYNGQIDGIAGPQTRSAVRAYQKREGLRQTARLDRETVQHMNLTASGPVQPNTASGSSAPQENLGPANRSSQNYNALPPHDQNYAAPQNASPSPPRNDQPLGTTPQNQ